MSSQSYPIRHIFKFKRVYLFYSCKSSISNFCLSQHQLFNYVSVSITCDATEDRLEDLQSQKNGNLHKHVQYQFEILSLFCHCSLYRLTEPGKMYLKFWTYQHSGAHIDTIISNFCLNINDTIFFVFIRHGKFRYIFSTICRCIRVGVCRLFKDPATHSTGMIVTIPR